MERKLDQVFSITEPQAQYDAALAVVKQMARDALANPPIRSRVAYQLAGLLACSALQQRPDDDPLVAILNLLGELELPSRHQSADASWERLSLLLNRL